MQFFLYTVSKDIEKAIQVLIEPIVHIFSPPFSAFPAAPGETIIGERGSYGKKGVRVMKKEWLVRIRKSQGKFGREVAHDAGITTQMYSAIETGERSPSVKVAKRIAAVLGFDWTLFFEEPSGGADSA